MSALEPVFSGAGGSSTSSRIAPSSVARGGGESDRIPALRQAIRGMEAQLMDLAFQSSTPERLADWLRVPLECAAAEGNLSVVKRLLAAGVGTETPKLMRSPPLLHMAAATGNESVVEELLKAGVDVHETDSARHDRTALHCAAAAGGDSAVRALTSAGANVDVLDATGWAPLHYACAGGYRAVVVFLLLNGARQRKTLSEEDSPFHLAAYRNHAGVIEDLLSFGKPVTGSFNAEGLTALHVAAKCGRVEACIALLRGGAKAGDRSFSGFSCLDLAAWSGHTGQLLRVLTAAEAADTQERRCSMALHHAVRANKPHTMTSLISLGADINFLKPGKLSNLHYAAGPGGLHRVTELLLLSGANVDEKCGGVTPLHMACSASHASIVQLLLHWGADENATGPTDSTPLDVIGTATVAPDLELLPDEFVRASRVKHQIRRMLKTAPADRIWRRRSWLVLCRARWLARVGGEEKPPSTHLDAVPSDATGGKKRRGKPSGSSLVVKPRDFSLGKGKSRGRNEGRGMLLSQATAAATAVVLRLGACSGLSDRGAGQAAGVARLDGRTRFVTVVEQLLLLREDSIFREVVTFL